MPIRSDKLDPKTGSKNPETGEKDPSTQKPDWWLFRIFTMKNLPYLMFTLVMLVSMQFQPTKAWEPQNLERH